MLASPLSLVTMIVSVIFKHYIMKVGVQKLVDWMASEDVERGDVFRLIQNNAK